MLKAAILFAIVAAAFAFAAPGLFPGDPDPAPVAGASAPGPAPAPRAAGFREAVLPADPRGQYAADVYVNGIAVRMLVDTARASSCCPAATAARLGLAPSGAKLKMKTANGTIEASPVRLGAIRLDHLAMTDVQAVVLPPAAGDANLLGASFLKRLLSVEQRDGVLVLRQ